MLKFTQKMTFPLQVQLSISTPYTGAALRFPSTGFTKDGLEQQNLKQWPTSEA